MTNENKEKNQEKENILLVEDQECPFEGMKDAFNQLAPQYYQNYNLETARCYNDAREKIQNTPLDLILLDHRMPRENQEGLERKNFESFVSTLENIGYSLIPLIRQENPNTIIVGTSSYGRALSGDYENPDYIMNKGTSPKELRTNLEDVLNKINRGK